MKSSEQNKLFINNRKGQRIAVLTEEAPNQKGLAFVMHGLGSNKDAAHIKTIAQAFLDNGYTVVRFDTTNTYGESDGDYADATTTNYYEDFEDVLSWAKTQQWYQEPFCLAGHSLGALCMGLYAEKYPEKVKAFIPISAAVSGKLSTQAPQYAHGELEKWQQTGWYERPSGSNPNIIKRLKWSHMEDRLKYDLLPCAGKLTMPVLLIVGELDESTPVSHQQLFYDALPGGNKELQIIKNAPHTFRAEEHLVELKQLVNTWLKGLE